MTSASTRIGVATLLLLTGCANQNFFAKNNPPPDQNTPAGQQNNLQGRGADADGRGGLFAGASQKKNPAADLSNGFLDQAYQFEVAGRMPEARDTYERVLKMQPDHPYAHHRLATIADKEGRFGDAENHYKAALKKTPHDADLLSDLGYSYYLQGREADSENALQEALRYDQMHKSALNNLGTLYAKRGDARQALAYFRRAGTEQEAQLALAQMLPPGQMPDQQNNNSEQYAAGPVKQIPSTDAGGGSRDFPNDATRRIAEDMERFKADMSRQNGLIAQEKNANQRVAAPIPGNQQKNVRTIPNDMDRANMTAAQREKAALEYLQRNKIGPGQMNQTLSEIDASYDNSVTQANRSRSVADIPPQQQQLRQQDFQQQGTQPQSFNRGIPSGPEDRNPLLSGSGPVDSGFNAPPRMAQQNAAPQQWNDSQAPPRTSQAWSGNTARVNDFQQTSAEESRWPTSTGAFPPAKGGNVIPAGGLQPQNTGAGNGPPDGRSRSDWDNARLRAAQLGLNAGPGQMFPVNGSQNAGAAQNQSNYPPQFNPTNQLNSAQYSSPQNNSQWGGPTVTPSAPQQNGAAGQPKGAATKPPVQAPLTPAQQADIQQMQFMQQIKNGPLTSPGSMVPRGNIPQSSVPSAQGAAYGLGDGGVTNAAYEQAAPSAGNARQKFDQLSPADRQRWLNQNSPGTIDPGRQLNATPPNSNGM